MSLNISKLQRMIDEGKFRKSDIIASSGISKGTLDNVLKGLDPKVSTLQAIADAVGVNISYFFDEEKIQVKLAGRDFTENDQSNHYGTENSGTFSSLEADLRDQIATLKSQLEDKERIIKLLESK